MTEKKAIYPAGIRFFEKHQNAPDFVLGTMIVTPSELKKWCDENDELLKDYQGNRQLRLQLKKGSSGVYATVDTYEPKPTGLSASTPSTDGLPF